MNFQPPEGMAPVVLEGRLNCTNEEFLANIKHNIRLGHPQVNMHAPNDAVLCLVGGGPSLENTFEELRELVWQGAKTAAVNGAYQWLVDRNIKPSAAIMLDGRPFNARFFETPVEGCKYLMASQCSPEALKVVGEREVYIWHAMSEIPEIEEELDDYYLKRYHKVVGGPTVTLKALHLLRMLGFQYFEIFGLDSCFMNGEHHGYEQSENDIDVQKVQKTHCAGRMFDCAPWHMAQARDLMSMIKVNGEMFFLNVHGDGLIAHMLKVGAEAWEDLDGESKA